MIESLQNWLSVALLLVNLVLQLVVKVMAPENMEGMLAKQNTTAL